MYTIMRQSIVLTALLALVLCGAYPVAVTALGSAIFPEQAAGSLLTRGDTIVGSKLIGQPFSGPRSFHGRPSAAGQGYDAMSSGGSNLGPTSAALAGRLQERAALRRRENPDAPLPVDLLTASGSGLDPQISPEAARFQVGRVAGARGLSPQSVSEVVERHIRKSELGLFGSDRVNVLELNLALDGMRP
jgi:K+-transporting ATPase ATPase C chain